MNKKLNIGLFIDTFFPMFDGVVNVVDNYARQLSKFCNVTVFAPVGRKDFDDSTLPYKVVRCKKKFPLTFLDYDLPLPRVDKNFLKQVENAKLDIVHIHSPFSIGKIAIKYAKNHNIPVVGTFHSQYKKDFYKSTKSKLITNLLTKSIARVFNQCDVLWTMNPACVDLAKSYGISVKAEIVPNATNLINFWDASELEDVKREIKERYNIKPNEKTFISLGRLVKLKNLDFVIEVCKVLKDNGFKFKLLLIGDGKEKRHFVSKVKKLGLENEVVFVGLVTSVEEKSKLLASSDLLVFPSSYDTDGIVRIEAAAFSVPTLFIEGSVASSIIRNGINGYIGKNDVGEFAQQIIEVFQNCEQYQKTRQMCHKDLYITWNDLSAQIFENYKSLIKDKTTKIN